MAEIPELSLAGMADEAVVLSLMQEFYVIEHLDFRRDIAQAALRVLWQHPEFGRVYLIRVHGGSAGYMVLTFGFSLEFHGRDALVDELYVREQYRDRGFGSACLQWAEDVCRQEGIQSIHLEVDRVNLRAKQLYHRNGYHDHDRHLLTKWLEMRPDWNTGDASLGL